MPLVASTTGGIFCEENAMASPWIKIRHDLPEDPAVISIADRLELSRDTVVGKLVRVWSWADQHLVTGDAPSVTPAFVDALVDVTGFADAMSAAGWLRIEVNGIAFPKFDRHMSQSAKKRALNAKRNEQYRDRKRRSSDAENVTVPSSKASPDEDEDEDEEHHPSSSVPSTSARDGADEVGPPPPTDGNHSSLRLAETIAFHIGGTIPKVAEAVERLGITAEDWEAWKAYGATLQADSKIKNWRAKLWCQIRSAKNPEELPEAKRAAAHRAFIRKLSKETEAQ